MCDFDVFKKYVCEFFSKYESYVESYQCGEKLDEDLVKDIKNNLFTFLEYIRTVPNTCEPELELTLKEKLDAPRSYTEDFYKTVNHSTSKCLEYQDFCNRFELASPEGVKHVYMLRKRRICTKDSGEQNSVLCLKYVNAEKEIKFRGNKISCKYCDEADVCEVMYAILLKLLPTENECFTRNSKIVFHNEYRYAMQIKESLSEKKYFLKVEKEYETPKDVNVIDFLVGVYPMFKFGTLDVKTLTDEEKNKFIEFKQNMNKKNNK